MVDDEERCQGVREWDLFLEEQKKGLGTDAIDRWAKSLKIVDFDAGNLYLEASDPFQVHWFEQYLRPLIKTSFKSMSGRPIRVYLTLIGAAVPSIKKEWKPPLDLAPDLIFSNCTFETYFAGETNGFNLPLLKDSLLKKSFNPIYLQGPSGVGKTHLLMAACHFLKEQGHSYFYVKADRFTQHIVAAIRSGAMTQLREQYRQNDVLVIDEIETLADRSASQEELFHTFNALHLAGKLILLAGSELPSQLKGIEPRLTSRFEWGLILSFRSLVEKERAQYFEQLLERKKISLETDFTQFCLSLFSSIPLLNRAADTLEVQLKGTKPTLPLLKNWLSSLIREQEKKALTSDAILKTVARHFDIHLADLQGRSQTQEHAAARQIAMYLCRNLLHFPYVKIAEIFSRDHSTVMTSVKLIEKKLQDNASIKESIAEITQALNQTILKS